MIGVCESSMSFAGWRRGLFPPHKRTNRYVLLDDRAAVQFLPLEGFCDLQSLDIIRK